MAWQREGSGAAKNFWSSLSQQTREKGKTLKCNNGVRHAKHEDGTDNSN